jgi:hypothetical protein
LFHGFLPGSRSLIWPGQILIGTATALILPHRVVCRAVQTIGRVGYFRTSQPAPLFAFGSGPPKIVAIAVAVAPHEGREPLWR